MPYDSSEFMGFIELVQKILRIFTKIKEMPEENKDTM
jgi:hypothetical protein